MTLTQNGPQTVTRQRQAAQMSDDVPVRPEAPDPRAGDGRPQPEPVRRGTEASVAAVRRIGRQLPRR